MNVIVHFLIMFYMVKITWGKGVFAKITLCVIFANKKFPKGNFLKARSSVSSLSLWDFSGFHKKCEKRTFATKSKVFDFWSREAQVRRLRRRTSVDTKSTGRRYTNFVHPRKNERFGEAVVVSPRVLIFTGADQFEDPSVKCPTQAFYGTKSLHAIFVHPRKSIRFSRGRHF